MVKFAKYPLFLSLKDKTALIIGFGKVGRRKLKKLINCGLKKILILDFTEISQLTGEQISLLKESGAFYEQRNWNEQDISEAFIVFACTDDFEENKKIGILCENKLCNNITEPDTGNFIVPATVNSGELCLAISTGENSPALASLLRKNLEPILQDYTNFASFLGMVRLALKTVVKSTEERQKILRLLINSDFSQFFLSKDFNNCANWLEKNIDKRINLKLLKMLPE